MSLFIRSLAFSHSETRLQLTESGINVGSLQPAIVGCLILRKGTDKKPAPEIQQAKRPVHY
ncbi:MAG: hypothetical protein PSX71_13235 [bacterium]|nr:hypothetical protein [bacterium]